MYIYTSEYGRSKAGLEHLERERGQAVVQE
jgi:hypothetical protein